MLHAHAHVHALYVTVGSQVEPCIGPYILSTYLLFLSSGRARGKIGVLTSLSFRKVSGKDRGAGGFCPGRKGYSDARAKVSAKVGSWMDGEVARRAATAAHGAAGCLAAGASQAGGEFLPRAPARADIPRVEAAAALQRPFSMHVAMRVSGVRLLAGRVCVSYD